MALALARPALSRPAEHQRLFRVRPLLIPALALIVWITSTFSVNQFPIWANLRWAFLVLLAIQGSIEIWKWGGDVPMPWPVVGFALFSLATFASATYSLIPLLSFYKAISYLLALVGLVFGIGLRHRGRPESWLRLLAGINLSILAISILTFTSAGSYNSGFFQGPFFNPNEFGASLALTLPALLWLRDDRRRLGDRFFVGSKLLTAAVLLDVSFIFLSRSRASLLVVGLVLLLYAAFRRSRLAWLLVYSMFVLLLAAPAVASQVSSRALYKGRDPQTAFKSRADEFNDTLRAAMSNPISGYGFGTSRGQTAWDGSLTAYDVGREKTNSFLGAIEEVGLIGAIPLFLGIGGVLSMAFSASRRTKWTADGVPATLLAIIAGGVLHSNFEAWLTAVGGFATFMFWATLGVFLMNLPSPARPASGSAQLQPFPLAPFPSPAGPAQPST